MKILILSCNTGEGHNSCARAISEELERKGDWGYIADGLAFLSTGTSKFVSGWHTRLYRYFPRLYGKGDEYAEKHPMNIKKHTAAYRMIRRGAKRLRKVIKAGGYDGVICTHLFPAMMVTGLVKKGTVTIPACFVATDYTASPPMEDVLAEIAAGMPENIELTVICGTNKQTAEKLRRRHGETPRVPIRGYVKDMSLMLDSADLYLTKAGGISTTEAAIKGVPLVLADAVGGCESRNLEFFVEHGAAVTAKTEELGRLCVSLLEDRRRLDAMAQAIERLRMEDAAEKICDYMRQRAGK